MSALSSSEEGTDVDSPSFASRHVRITLIGPWLAYPLICSTSGVAMSTAAKTREKQLRDDSMAIVLGPLYVDCKGCGKRIKLSTKSLYDLSHWRTHRTRCLKRQSRVRKKPSSKPDVRKRCLAMYSIYTNADRMIQLGTSEVTSLSRSEKPGIPLKPADLYEPRVPAIKENRSSSQRCSIPSTPLTPPYTDEATINKKPAPSLLSKSSTTSHEEGDESVISIDHLPLRSEASTPHPLPADVIFADYLLRSNRQMVLSTSNVQPRWQDWTWAHLRLPQFQALDHDPHSGELCPPNDAVLSLSLLA